LSKLILKDYVLPVDQGMIREASSPPKKRDVVLCSFDMPLADFTNYTRNERFYSGNLWKNCFESDVVQEMLHTNTFFGEADHPLEQDRLETYMPYVSHAVRNPRIDESRGLVYGTIDVLDTPRGRIVKTFIDYGSQLGASSRGAGEVEQDGRVCESDYVLVGFDLVCIPSNVAARAPAHPAQGIAAPPSFEEAMGLYISQMQEQGNINQLREMRKIIEYAGASQNDSLVRRLDESIANLNKGCPSRCGGHGHDHGSGRKVIASGTNLTGGSQAHKDLEEALGYVQKLKKENAELRLQLSQKIGSANSLLETKSSRDYGKQGKKADKGQVMNERVLRELKDLQAELDESLYREEELQVSCENLELYCSDMEAYAESLEERIRSEQQEISKLNKKLKDLQGVVEQYEQELQVSDADSKRLKEANRKVKSLEAECRDLREQLAEERQRYEEAHDYYESALDALSSKVAGGDELREVYETKISQAHDQLDDMARYANDLIGFWARELGVSPDAIRGRLPENYTYADLNQVVEALKDYNVRKEKLPFALPKGAGRDFMFPKRKRGESFNANGGNTDAKEETDYEFLNEVLQHQTGSHEAK